MNETDKTADIAQRWRAETSDGQGVEATFGPGHSRIGREVYLKKLHFDHHKREHVLTFRKIEKTEKIKSEKLHFSHGGEKL